jgi:hypothetical protein
MIVLSSKKFSSGADGFVSDIQQFIDQYTGHELIEVMVRITAKGKRSSKEAAIQQMKALLVGQPTIWEQSGYRFNFATGEYTWGDKAIYLTANEALFFYRRFVLQDATWKTQRYYVSNARRRLGKAFLAELTRRKVHEEERNMSGL